TLSISDGKDCHRFISGSLFQANLESSEIFIRLFPIKLESINKVSARMAIAVRLKIKISLIEKPFVNEQTSSLHIHFPLINLTTGFSEPRGRTLPRELPPANHLREEPHAVALVRERSVVTKENVQVR